ncbi:MAG TPA: hypothetical protein VGJ92_02155 [Methanocella sp.]|jgi:hypothetical protein
MAPDAGFGIVLTLRQSMLQDMVKVFYDGGRLKHRWPLGDPSQILVADFFLDVPTIELSGASPDDLILSFQLRGPLIVNVPGGSLETSKVVIKVRERVPHDITLKYVRPTATDRARSNLILGIKAGHAVNELLDMNIYGGGLFTLVAQQLIESLMPYLIIAFLSEMADEMPSFDLVVLFGPAINQVNPRIRGKSLTGFLAVGFDVPIDGRWTEGDPGQMVDTTAGLDLGVWINPNALAVFFGGNVGNIGNNGVNLEYLHIIPKEGHLAIDGKASATGGAATFSMSLCPRLVRPGATIPVYDDDDYNPSGYRMTPSRDELWFEIFNLQYDTDEDWWVSLLRGLSFALEIGIVNQIIEGYVDMIRLAISSYTGQQHAGFIVGERVQEITIAGIPEPTVRIKVDCFDCHEDGIQIATQIKPQFSSKSGWIRGPTSVPIEDLARASLNYAIEMPSTVAADDPDLMVRWTVRGKRSNKIFLNTDDIAANNLYIDLESIKPQIYFENGFTVECRVYLALGPDATDYFNGNLYVPIIDRLDRSHRFVRWNHYVLEPIVKVEESGSKTVLGYELQYRQSKIHRTDFPGRCLMVSRYSITKPFIDPSRNVIVSGTIRETELVYLDDLPFQVADLVKNRRAVCDYCFFGGPDKKLPIWP